MAATRSTPAQARGLLGRWERGWSGVQEGDDGTWFGVLLEGSVSVEVDGIKIVRATYEESFAGGCGCCQ